MLTQTDKAHDLAERFGGESEGEFAPAGIPISRIAESYGTPFYLYHGEMISERVRRSVSLELSADSSMSVFV